jgi:hypothetical protein
LIEGTTAVAATPTPAGDHGALETPTTPLATLPAAAPSTGKTASRRSRRAPSDKPACGEPTAAGGMCSVAPLTGRKRCRMHESKHDPSLLALVRADQSRGGAAALRAREFGIDLGSVNLKDPDEMRRILAEAARAVALGRIPAAVAGAVASLVGTALRVVETEPAASLRELEKKIEERLANADREDRR